MNLTLNVITILIGIYSVFKILKRCRISIKTVISVLIITLFELYCIYNLLVHIYLKYTQPSNSTILKFAMHFSEEAKALDNIMVIFILVITIVNIRRYKIMKNKK